MNACDISLYAILDPSRIRGRPLAELAQAAARGGATLLQYRDKHAETRELVNKAMQIREALEPFNVPLIINDRVDVALAVGAQGVHVGQDDMVPADVRRLMGADAIVGLSNKTIDHAQAAPLELLDYVFVGGVFETQSKDNKTALGIAGWQKIAARFRAKNPGMPVGAIAGIDQTNLAPVMAAGADGVAVISAIFMADDVETATRDLKSIIEATR